MSKEGGGGGIIDDVELKIDRAALNDWLGIENIATHRFEKIKRRIEPGDKAPIITSKYNYRKYKLVDMYNYKDPAKLHHTSRLFYLIFLSEESNNLCVLFPTGSVLKDIDINTDQSINNFLDFLVTTILSDNDKSSYNKLILCGHSFGAVLALYTAKIIRERSTTFFTQKVIVVASAPFRFLPPNPSDTFNNLDNIWVFATCCTFSDTIFYDGFIDAGMTELVNYTPIHLLHMHRDTSRKRLIDKVISPPYPDNAEAAEEYLAMSIHEWKIYLECFDYLLNISNGLIIFTGGKRLRKKSRRTVRRKSGKRATRTHKNSSRRRR